MPRYASAAPRPPSSKSPISCTMRQYAWSTTFCSVTVARDVGDECLELICSARDLGRRGRVLSDIERSSRRLRTCPCGIWLLESCHQPVEGPDGDIQRSRRFRSRVECTAKF